MSRKIQSLIMFLLTILSVVACQPIGSIIPIQPTLTQSQTSDQKLLPSPSSTVQPPQTITATSDLLKTSEFQQTANALIELATSEAALTQSAAQTFTAEASRMVEIDTPEATVPPTEQPPEQDTPGTITLSNPWDDYAPQLLAYLNAGYPVHRLQRTLNALTLSQDGLTWTIRSQVFAVDATADSSRDVILDMIFYTEGDQPVYGGIYAFYQQDGQYLGGSILQIFGARFSGVEAVTGTGIRGVRDMNQDSIPEIIVAYLNLPQDVLAIGPQFNFSRSFQILSWDGENFVDQIQTDGGLSGGQIAYVTNGDGWVSDTDGDGNQELVLRFGGMRQPGVYHPLLRTRTETWTWNGAGFSQACIENFSPVYRFHAIQDGDDATLCGDYQRALESYQRAIFDESLQDWKPILFYDAPISIETSQITDPEERPRLSAYARYRILLLHTLQGYENEALIVYDTLQEKFPVGEIGHPYAELATVFWETYQTTGDITSACQDAVQYAANHSDETVWPLGEYYEWYATRYTRNYQPEDLCPFGGD